jgi:hypothetical protein
MNIWILWQGLESSLGIFSLKKRIKHYKKLVRFDPFARGWIKIFEVYVLQFLGPQSPAYLTIFFEPPFFKPEDRPELILDPMGPT